MVYDFDKPVSACAFGRVIQRHGAWHNGRRLKCHLAIFCVGGGMSIETEGQIYRVSEGDVLIITEGAFYKPLDGGECEYYFFHFTASLASEVQVSTGMVTIVPHLGLDGGHAYNFIGERRAIVTVPSFTKKVPFSIREIFERADKLHPEKCFTDKLLLDTLIRELLLGIEKANGSVLIPKRFGQILDYVSMHISEPISLSALAELFGISESYLSRLFKTELNMKPSEYINGIRVSAAASMLTETNMTVSEISDRTGYSSVYYFSRVFKKMTGKSPLEVRKGK